MNAPFLLWLLLPGAAYKTPAMGGKKANPPSRSKGARLQNLKCSTSRNSLVFSGDLRSWQITNNQKPLRVRILNPRPRVTEQAWLLWGELKRKVVDSPGVPSRAPSALEAPHSSQGLLFSVLAKHGRFLRRNMIGLQLRKWLVADFTSRKRSL